MASFHRAASINELPAGSGKTVQVNGKTLALFNVNGNFHATDETCPHQGGPLGEGSLDGKLISCPWHGWTFDVTNGECPVIPGMKIACYATKVEGDAVFIQV